MSAIPDLPQERALPRARLAFGTRTLDGLFLAVAALLSLGLFLPGLGFYSDDWVFLSLLEASEGRGTLDLVQALHDGDVVIRQRPVQIAYLVGLYQVFGLNPTGYHLANALLLAAIPTLLYLAFREAGGSRRLALAIAVVYALLPHYSTDRFWIAAHQATISMAAYGLSLYADLRAVRQPTLAGLLRWKLLAAVGLVVSGLAYEVALPLFLLNPLLAWYVVRRHSRAAAAHQVLRARAVAFLTAQALPLLVIVAFKALITVRANVTGDVLAHAGQLAAGAVRVNFGTYGVGLPYVVAWILTHQPSLPLLVLAAGLGGLIFAWLHQLPEQEGSEPDWPALIGVGLVVFALGYAVFLVNTDVWFTSTSLGNRVAIAAALGVAITLIAGLGWAARWLPTRARHSAFCLGVTVLAVSGFLINNTLAQFWTTAYQRQQAILADIRQHVPALPAHSTLVLDGVCLERGGAYAFTGRRDLAALLRLTYNEPGLQATAITNSPRVEASGLSVYTYRDWDHYPYGHALLVYHFPTKTLRALVDAAAAQQYFQMSSFVPERDCPPGFAWGWNAP